MSKLTPITMLLALGVLMTITGSLLRDNAISIALSFGGMSVVFAVVGSMAWMYAFEHRNWVEGTFRI